MNRLVEPELLDVLPPDDPQAIAARGGLRRVNVFMGNARILSRAAASIRLPAGRTVRRIADLGAGDGSFAYALAQRLAPLWPGVTVDLVDRHNLLTPQLRERFQRLGWTARPQSEDVFEWLSDNSNDGLDLIVANLFLHHFDAASLRVLLEKIAARTANFASCDPLRSERAVRFCPFLRLIGCNAVVRNDAAISIRAGFQNSEIQELWPDPEKWDIEECQSGLFSHLFIARRKLP